MLVLNIICKSKEEKANLCYRICESLQGSPAFVSSEIAVSDDDPENSVVSLFVGNQNSHDVMYDLNSADFHNTKN